MISATIVLTAAAAATLLAALYLYYSYSFSYWKRRGVPHPKPTPFVGNFADILLTRKSFASVIRDFAHQFQSNGYCGIYQWAKPILLVYEPEMVKQIICKDFSSFHDRGIPYDEKNDPLSAHLFNLAGPKWRNLRIRLSPTFTSGKLKLMFPLMRDVADELSLSVERQEAGGEVNLSKLLSLFSTDVIGSCAFGMQCNCLRDGSSEFLAMSQNLFRMTFGQLVRFLLSSLHPKLVALVPMKMLFPKTNAFFVKLMEDTVAFREQNKVERNDFVQLMMQLRHADLAQGDPEHHIDLTANVMAAQAFVFFLAGLDNVTNTVSFSLGRLALDPELQERAAREVQDVIRDHGGELSYEALRRMDLVERIIREGLRLWSPIGTLIRKCNATTRVGDLVLDKGQSIMIITECMHRNPEYFPEPERFDPERFTDEAKEQRHPYVYLPFGEGPRNCIAERFAILEMKLCLAVLLRDFKFTTGPSFEKNPELDMKSFFPRPKNDFKLCASKRTSKESVVG